jgi:hypothetical protein
VRRDRIWRLILEKSGYIICVNKLPVYSSLPPRGYTSGECVGHRLFVFAQIVVSCPNVRNHAKSSFTFHGNRVMKREVNLRRLALHLALVYGTCSQLRIFCTESRHQGGTDQAAHLPPNAKQIQSLGFLEALGREFL